ncbi:MAG: hypothetical protein JWO73_715 [Candidatus Taylorbacteria bacterium]|nr:hypothetical protein [Candidatus Taylorbacteria bacterium]
MENKPKHIHIVGICGVGTGALAVAFHQAGWKVTGSDKGFYPPVSTNLAEAGIEYYAGWHPEKIGKPDVVMVGGSGTSLSNPEVVYAKEHGIPFYPYAQILQKYFIRPNSIVTAGTWGKTTTSALLSFVLIEAGMNPSYFTGGLSMSHPTGALIDASISKWSVVEGDEYQTAIYDKLPKFAYYDPTHLLLTSVSWDHADLYPTEADYFKTFEKLVAGIPASGVIVACADDEGVNKIIGAAAAKVVTYGMNEEVDYRYRSVQHTKAGIAFDIDHAGQAYHVASPMLGRYNVENIAGVFAMAHHIGISADKIIAALAAFKGIKRRLERRLDGQAGDAAQNSGITVIDTHAPTPEKAASGLESIREVYGKKIIAIYEPNIGGRQKSSIGAYDKSTDDRNGGAFRDADLVIIPRLTKLKIDETKTDPKDQPLEGQELADHISHAKKEAIYIEDDAALVSKVIAEARSGEDAGAGNVIVFLGSHGFRGMIEETVAKLK